MPIDFETEINEIIIHLGREEGYLDCEKVIIHNIKKHIDNKIEDQNIVTFLETASTQLHNKIQFNQAANDCTNYRYAAGFVDTLLKMPYWKSWMKTIEM